MSLSLESLNELATILGQQSLSVGRADFEAQAALLGKVRRELLEAIAEATEASP